MQHAHQSSTLGALLPLMPLWNFILGILRARGLFSAPRGRCIPGDLSSQRSFVLHAGAFGFVRCS